ncbi:MAG: ABC transporter permease subunit [Pseudomonadota bacterium]
MNKTFIGIPFISMTLLISVAGAGIMYYAIAIKNINPAQYEAAHMDGATWFQIKTRIIMPQLLPMFGVMLLFSLISGFQIWEAIYILAPYDSTASSLYRVISDGFFFGKYGFASAECIGMILIIFIITKIKERIETH